MIMCKNCCMNFIRMQGPSGCTNPLVAFTKAQVNALSLDGIHKYLNQALEQGVKS